MTCYPTHSRFAPALHRLAQPATSSVTVVQAISIRCSFAKAFDFMSDAPQWLPWAMPGLESVQPLPFGQWLLKTGRGLAKLRPRTNSAQGELNYELIDPTAGSWLVPARMVPTATGCHLAITFTKPERLPLAAFEAGMHRTAAGLNTLKLILEQD